MKLKFANSLMVASLVVAMAGCFTSCKDTDEDMFNQIEDQYNSLEDKLEANYATLQQLKELESKHDKDVEELKAQLKTLGYQNLDEVFGGNASQFYQDTEAAIKLIQSLAGEDGSLQWIKDMETVVSQHTAQIVDLQAKFANYYTKEETDQKLEGLAKELQESLKTALEEAKKEMASAITDLSVSVQAAKDQIAALDGKVTALNSTIESLKLDFEKLGIRVDNLEKRINSLVVSEVNSAVFGSLNAPIDVQSMILFNYYGESDHDVVFPNFRPMLGDNFGYTGIDENGKANPLISNEQAALLGVTATTVEETNKPFVANNGDLGSVYFTANPSNLNLAEGYNFSLVNSRGEEAPIKLNNPVEESDHLVIFGQSRADDVALWRADAQLPVENIQALRLDLEPGLKSAVKDLLNERSISNALEVAAKVYKTVSNNSSMPAYGLKATWKDAEGNTQNCYGQYNMAATTFRPLSYSTFADADFSGKLPTLPSFDKLLGDLDFDFGDINLNLKIEPIKIEGITISVDDITISPIDPAGINKKVTVNVEVNAKGTYDYPEIDFETGVVTPNPTEINVIGTGTGTAQIDAIDDIVKAINDALIQAQNSINDQLDQINGISIQINEMIANIEKQINDIMDSISEEVNSSLDKVLNDLQGKVNEKVEAITERIRPFYSRFESLTDRLENILKQPNHYMQVFMLYKAGDNMGRLSSSSVVPSIWKSTSGNGYATLVPINYNAELVSPAYKKFVAVTNVYKENDRSVSALNDEKCKSLLKAANNGEYMNQVIEGARQTVEFDFNGAVGGNYTYEIFYQAVDFHGHYSTNKYYVNVK